MRFLSILLLVLTAHGLFAANVSDVWANDGGDKVTQDELRAHTGGQAVVVNSVWDGTTIRQFGARNEVVSINILLEVPTAAATNVTVIMSNLTGPGGALIRSNQGRTSSQLFDWTSTEIELYYVRYLQIKGMSVFLGGNPADTNYDFESFMPAKLRTAHGASWTTRPNHDKFYPDIAAPLELHPNFTIAAGTNQAIWADIYIPKTAPAGVYTGTVTIKEGSTATHTVPMRLTVRNFVLPDLPTAKTMLCTSASDLSPRYGAKTNQALQAQRLVAHRHKISLIADDATQSGDAPGASYVSVLDGTLFTAANGYAGPGTGVGTNVYSIGTFGGWKSGWGTRLSSCTWNMGTVAATSASAHGLPIGSTVTLTIADVRPDAYNGRFSCEITSATTFTYSLALSSNPGAGQKGECISQTQMQTHADSWESWFQMYAPSTERFLYLIDESSHYDLIQQWANWMGAATRKPLSMATIPAPQAMANTPDLKVVTSTFTAGLTAPWQNAVAAIKADQRKKFYMYNGGRPGEGSFMTDDDGTALRATPWIQYKKGVSRWFYWEATYYNDSQGGRGQNDLFHDAQTFGGARHADPSYGLIGWNSSNGDGVLLYPGTDLVHTADSYGIGGPIASLRLKHWRRGIQDVDYLALAKAISPSAVDSIVNTMVTKVVWDTPGCAPTGDYWLPGTKVGWSDIPDDWEAQRLALANLIETVNHAPVASAQNVSTAEDTPKAITLVATDADGDPLTYAIVANPTHGTLSGIGTTWTYTPAANYNGTDSCTFKASDGMVNSNVATVSITVTAVNDPPVVSAASAAPNPVIDKTASLSATASDDGGEPALTYTWSATGPAAVAFSANRSNAAKMSVATFSKPGSYILTVTAKDIGNLSGTMTVVVAVNPTLTTMSISPSSVSVKPGGSVDFNAKALDQFGVPLAAQPTVTWAVAGSGVTIDSATGRFTADLPQLPPHTSVSHLVTASSSGVVGTALAVVSNEGGGASSGGGDGCGGGAALLVAGLGLVLTLRRRS